MKKNCLVSAPATPSSFWRIVAVVSLVFNAGLAFWLWHGATTPAAPLATVSSLPVSVARPRELTPYAALGSFMAENNGVSSLGWSEAQFTAFQDGFRASFEGKGIPLDDEARRLRDEISRRVQGMMTGERPDPVEDYFRTLREKENVQRTASGLHYRITEEGSGPVPKAADTVVISFTARLPGGEALPPLSRVRSRAAVKDLLPGLAESVQLLRVGGKALVYLPPALAFTDANWPPQLPKGTPILFFVELHEIVGM